MEKYQSEFIENIAKYVNKYRANYGICVTSPIIAQAILESGWGKSYLAKYHNYFGLKSSRNWSGKSVSMETGEEYEVGVFTTVTALFRCYDTMDAGVKGYFEFINYSRYSNLKGITDPETYLKTIKADGYCTSSTYVNKTMKLIKDYNLTDYDEAVTNNEETSSTPETSNTYGEAGCKIILENTKCYVASTSTKAYSIKSGAYYLWEDVSSAQNGKVRITNRKERAGVKGQVTCWIDVDDVICEELSNTYRTHTVVKGETLWKLATIYLGSGKRYPEIMNLNGLTSTTLYPNMIIKIPNK